MQKYKDVLEVYNDKAFVYSVLCSKAARYYKVLQYSFSMPLILTSVIMTYLNSNEKTFAEQMAVLNPIVNITTAVFLSINNLFKFETHGNNFKQMGMKYQKLSHLIESKVLNEELSQDFVNSIVDTYDNYCENTDEIPHHICSQIRKTYGGVKHLPVVANGVEKVKRTVFDVENVILDSSLEVQASPRTTAISPRVLATKKPQGWSPFTAPKVM